MPPPNNGKSISGNVNRAKSLRALSPVLSPGFEVVWILGNSIGFFPSINQGGEILSLKQVLCLNLSSVNFHRSKD